MPVVALIALLGLVASVACGDDDEPGARADQPGTEATSTTSTSSNEPASSTTTGVEGQTPTTAATDPEPAPTTALTTAPEVRPGARIQVKFAPGSGVRLRDGALVSETGADLSPLNAVLAAYPGTTVQRLFQRPEADLEAERVAAEARTGLPQPDLNLYYRLTLPEGVDPDEAIADLSALDVVDRAYADPVAAPPP